MKIGITSTGPNLDDHVEARFGRCPYFLVVDTDSMQFEAVENPNVAAGGGAGIQSAQLMADRGVEAVLTGNCGPNAFQVFSASGIRVIVGVSGNVRDAVASFQQGSLSSSSEANVSSHFGMGVGGCEAPPDVGGGGMGRGMGRGMGQGMGMGRGRSLGISPGAGDWPGSPAEDLESLKAQARALEEQLKTFKESITGLQRADPSPLVALVDAGKCTVCGVCLEVCAPGAISMIEAVEVDREKCTGCAQCVTACPEDALSLHARS
jgi:predicted Fe-Mo cluster-binding NifX family protein/ferredoxin